MGRRSVGDGMAEGHTFERAAIERTGAPGDYERVEVDVRKAGPPEPLVRTLEALADLDDRTVLIQVNDRAPRHLFPKLDDRGYTFETVALDDAVVTAIWKPAD